MCFGYEEAVLHTKKHIKKGDFPSRQGGERHRTHPERQIDSPSESEHPCGVTPRLCCRCAVTQPESGAPEADLGAGGVGGGGAWTERRGSGGLRTPLLSPSQARDPPQARDPFRRFFSPPGVRPGPTDSPGNAVQPLGCTISGGWLPYPQVDQIRRPWGCLGTPGLSASLSVERLSTVVDRSSHISLLPKVYRNRWFTVPSVYHAICSKRYFVFLYKEYSTTVYRSTVYRTTVIRTTVYRTTVYHL